MSHHIFKGVITASVGLLLFLSVLWTLPWKGYALWKSARRGEKWWFIALLLINTLAVLEILYIFVFSKGKKKQSGKASKE